VRALLGPRFGVEATFIVVVAIIAGLLELPLPAILAAVFGSWALVALAEILASRHAAGRPATEPEPGAPPAPPAPITLRPEPEPLRFEPVTPEVAFEPAPTVADVEDAAAEPEPVLEQPTVVTAAAEPVADEPEPEPAPERVPEPPAVVTTPSVPQEWNVWDLERRLQAQTGGQVADEERTYLLLYLREYASPDGVLPVEFDALVRESFGDLVEAER
jgi:hypothetical protein